MTSVVLPIQRKITFFPHSVKKLKWVICFAVNMIVSCLSSILLLAVLESFQNLLHFLHALYGKPFGPGAKVDLAK